MSRQNERVINSGTNIRLSIGLIASMVAGYGLFLFAKIEQHHYTVEDAIKAEREYTERQFAQYDKKLSRKASKNAAGDRYTGAQAEQFEKSVEQRLLLIKEKNDTQHKAYERELDHITKDHRALELRVDNHYNRGK